MDKGDDCVQKDSLFVYENRDDMNLGSGHQHSDLPSSSSSGPEATLLGGEMPSISLAFHVVQI